MKRLFSLLFALLTLSAGLAHAQGNREPDNLPTPENNQIVYRSSDHQKITPNNVNAFGAPTMMPKMCTTQMPIMAPLLSLVM